MVRMARNNMMNFKHLIGRQIRRVGGVNAGLQGASQLRPMGPIFKKAASPDDRLEKKEEPDSSKMKSTKT